MPHHSKVTLHIYMYIKHQNCFIFHGVLRSIETKIKEKNIISNHIPLADENLLYSYTVLS